MFRDRSDAGKRLAEALEAYRRERPLVLAIPKGGLPVAIEVAKGLDAQLSAIIARKLPYPDAPEAGFGAVAEDGSVYLRDASPAGLTNERIESIIEEQKGEIARRIELLRGGAPLPELSGRTVILVDDGIAAGSTMRAAVGCCRSRGVGRVIVAAPVSSQRVRDQFATIADEVVVLETPADFRAVAQVYEEWHDVSDDEALEALREASQAPTTAETGWEHFPHDADIGVQGIGQTKEEAFTQAAVALTAVVTDPESVRPEVTVDIECDAPDDALLLYDWLNALVYEMAVRRMLFSAFDVRIEGGHLSAHATGEPVDRERHAPAVEVKGATCTCLDVHRDPDTGLWLAECVVDV